MSFKFHEIFSKFWFSIIWKWKRHSQFADHTETGDRFETWSVNAWKKKFSYTTWYMYYIFIQSSIEWNFSCSHVLATVKTMTSEIRMCYAHCISLLMCFSFLIPTTFNLSILPVITYMKLLHLSFHIIILTRTLWSLK